MGQLELREREMVSENRLGPGSLTPTPAAESEMAEPWGAARVQWSHRKRQWRRSIGADSITIGTDAGDIVIGWYEITSIGVAPD